MRNVKMIRYGGRGMGSTSLHTSRMDLEEAARDPDSTVMKILYLACQSLRPTVIVQVGGSSALPLAGIGDKAQ